MGNKIKALVHTFEVFVDLEGKGTVSLTRYIGSQHSSDTWMTADAARELATALNKAADDTETEANG